MPLLKSSANRRCLVAVNFPASGLGDRLCSIACLCLRAEKENFGAVHINWKDFELKMAHPSTPAYRHIDVKLDNVLAHMHLPDTLKISETCESESVFADTDFSGGLSLTRLTDADPAAAKVRAQFSFTPKVLRVIERLVAEPFAALHLRRTDKVRPLKACWSMITETDLDKLNARTIEALERIAAAGTVNFFICTDDDASLPLFTEKISALGGKIIGLPAFEKWEQTYYDLAMLSHAQVIVQSNVNSAFSNFAAFLGNSRLIRPLENVNP